MIKKNRAQRWFVSCIDADTNRLASGQAASITATLSKNEGSFSATSDINPTEVGTSGTYYFELTANETNANTVDIVAVHSSAKYVMRPVDGERWSQLAADVVAANGSSILAGDFHFTVSAGGKLHQGELELVPGDDYVIADGTGILLTDGNFPDLTAFTSAKLTVRVGGVVVIDHHTTSSLDNSTKTVSFSMADTVSALLADYVGQDAEFDVEAHRADGSCKTIARGSAVILDPLD
jgi:hypothetical protein